MADTWSNIIRDALIEIGVKEPGEALEADEEQDSFRRLQGMFGEWGLEGLLVPGLSTVTHTFTAATAGQVLTFGPAASNPDVATTVQIEEIASLNYQRAGQQRSRPMDASSYAVISELRRPYRHWPQKYYFDAAFPVAKLWFDANTEAGDFIEITGRGHFSRDIALNSDPGTILPPGYREAVLLNLAVKLGPSYGAKGGRDATVSDETRRAARRGKSLIKQRNLQVLDARIDQALASHSTGMLSGTWGRR